MAGRSGRRKWEILFEGVIYLSALTAIVALFLIFVFIGKEALPVLTSPEIQK